MKYLTKIFTFNDTIYVTTHIPFYYTTRAGLLMTGAEPDAISRARLGQFNQVKRSHPRVEILCWSKDQDKYLGFFIRKTKVERLHYRRWSLEDHPLYKSYAERAAKLRKSKGE